MEFIPTVNTVISSGEAKNFTMAVNAKSFSILTSGIYKNKIRAVIREYSTNALDSHIESGNPEPFEVHLPTVKESYFYVRDYGTGLDEEQFENVFFRFFESTKDKSNEYNGTLGLGAKSFYSIGTKSFTVESWKDGFHYIYNCFLGQSGTPEYSQLLKEYSQDPEGLKVQAAIDPKDIEEFEEEAQDVYKHFERQPKFIGKQIELENCYEDKKEHYKFNSYDGCVAVMGNVAYPVENNYNLSKYSGIIKANITLFFNIGELTFTPSRESLEYTEFTIKALKKKFDLVYKDINEEIVSQINSSNTEFEAVGLYNSIYETYSKKIRGIVRPDTLVFNGKELSADPIELNCEVFAGGGNKRKGSLTLPVNSTYKYVVNDLNVGVYSRCQEIQKTGKTVYLIEKDELANIKITYPEFIKASILPKPKRYSKERVKLGSFRLMTNNRFVTEAWKECEIKDATSKYYIVRKGYRPIYNGIIKTPRNIFEYASQAGITENIYGVSQKEEKNILALGFINIYDAIKVKQQEIINELDLNKYFINENYTYSEFARKYEKFFDNLKKISSNDKIKDHEILKIFEVREFLNKNKDSYYKFTNKIATLGNMGYHYVKTPKDTLLTKYQKIIDKYGFLNYNNYYNNGFDKEYFVFYILGVDYAGNI